MDILFLKNKKTNLDTGALGEKIAANYLEEGGYKILETNFKNPLGRRLGEIDLIAQKDGVLVFVEVKTRNFEKYKNSLPEENITPSKLHKLSKSGQFYIKSKHLWDSNYRFDAVSVWIDNSHKAAKIKHIENIFY
jgi:putative endonuclease